ncbi:hypothetical protein SARC_08872 [Sphaeroforma arctica JP610]|uniref:Uncharacterized protein n=1 Tax=Sphaeroforma arctica JP610 TaxID=667725 RepID=A0A0L0FPG1_9EUKA|nr:hypothetical protein SARC_08872 [Sphaeroforma arctica JP610]KNC78700.1 hypothetical protein SARC_08872 [Sphaeroforma arctica JP610]|eukprot:XP_014152602.1 hypothetical protein SARC_08872 [Sphaeroforma arctica JP610]
MHGRVITKASGAKEWDSRLSGSHPFRKVVWAVGADALSEYTYQHLHDPIRMLTELGWHKDEVLSMVEKGFEFQLIVWGGNDPATGQCDKSTDLNRATIPAAWPIAWQKVRKGYQQDGIELPFVTDQVLKKLHTTHFSELTGGGCKRHGSRWQCGSTEAQNAFNELKYGQAGLDYFLTLDRPSALQVRAFLCNVLQFDTLYTGLGYTQTDEGVLTHAYNWAEFLLYNREISTLPYAQRLPIHIYPDNFGVDR